MHQMVNGHGAWPEWPNQFTFISLGEQRTEFEYLKFLEIGPGGAIYLAWLTQNDHCCTSIYTGTQPFAKD